MARRYKSKESKKRAMKGYYGRKYGGTYGQRGRSDERVDRRRRAKKPGWRRTTRGKRFYFERRRNRSDYPGKKV